MQIRLALTAFLAAALLTTATTTPPKTPKPQRSSRAASADELMARRLTLEERVAQLIVVRGYGDYLPTENQEYRKLLHWVRDLHIGGMIVANRIRSGRVINAQPFEMAAFLNYVQRFSKTPLIFASDFEHGASMRVAETARFPYFMAYGATHDLTAVSELGAATAREARALGITWIFAPDADVNNNPANPIINTRSFGEDPLAVAAGVSAFIEGAHRDLANYVLVTPKHFPGHGDTSEDSHMQLARLDQPKERIESLELVPFRASIEHGADAVMTAHMAVPAFEPQAIPATVSKAILTGLLRNEMGFKGLIVTDAMDMQGVVSLFSQGEAAVRAVEAGADVVLMPSDPEACIRGLIGAVHRGRISEKRIDESVVRVLAAKRRVGLFKSHAVNLDRIADAIEDPKLNALAQHVAERAITLVKDDKHLFPLTDPASACLAVLNESRFSSQGQTIVDEITRRNTGMQVFLANPTMPDAELTALSSVMNSCKQIYIPAFVTVAAYRGSVALEGGLTTFVDSLTKSNIPIALISLGSPYLYTSFPDVSAYAATFSSTSTSELAVAKAIFGEIPISGKLPISIPGLAKVGEGLEVLTRSELASQDKK